MAIVNPGTLIALQQSFQALFLDSLGTATPVHPLFAMEMQSNKMVENLHWLGRVPPMREWIGTKTLDGLRGFNYYIQLKDYESTLQVDRNDIETDQLGMYPPRIRELGVRAATNPDKLLSQARVAGDTTLAYDGQFFYDTDHAEGSSGTLSNKLTGTGTTDLLIAADFKTARAAMMRFKDDRGEPFIEASMLINQSNPQFIVTCPPDLWSAFETVFTAQHIGTTSNTLFGAARVMVDSRLTDVNDWYLDYVGGLTKPFINVVRKPASFVALEDPTSERVFLNRQFLYGVESSGTVSYALWQHSIKVTNT